jgi:hypothetical protein
MKMKSSLCITVLTFAGLSQAFATYAVFDSANFAKAVEVLKSNHAQEKMLNSQLTKLISLERINQRDLEVSQDIFKSLGTVDRYWGQGERSLRLMKEVIPDGPLDSAMGDLIKSSASLKSLVSMRTRQIKGLLNGEDIPFSELIKLVGKTDGIGYNDLLSVMTQEWNFKTLESSERSAKVLKELEKSMEESKTRVTTAKTLNETAAAQASVQITQADIAAEQLKTQQMEAAREAAADAHQANILEAQEARRSTQEAIAGAFD